MPCVIVLLEILLDFFAEPTSIMGHDVVLTRESPFRTFQTHISKKIQCNTALWDDHLTT